VPLLKSSTDWDSCIVVVGGTRWGHTRSSERFLAGELARHRPVLWVDPPLSVARARLDGEAQVRSRVLQVGPQMARLTPSTVPGVTRLLLGRVATHQVGRAIRRSLRQLGASAQAVIVAGTIDLLDSVPGAVRVLYGTDDWVAGATLMGRQVGAVRRAEARQLRKADVVLAVSDRLQARWRGMGTDPVLLPNGADVRTMATVDSVAPAPDVDLRPPIAGLVGQISARIDLRMLSAVAARGVSLLLVGPILDSPGVRLEGLERLTSLDNVTLAGARPFESLPSYYRTMSVGLTPYRDTDFNNASFPLKTMEYLAAGLPVVSSDLRANSALDPHLIHSSADPEEFADLVVRVVNQAPTRRQVEARRAFAARHSWQVRAEQVLALIDQRA
jgi:teichuronic acid biosynthesis glycosyltransferase TuaH